MFNKKLTHLCHRLRNKIFCLLLLLFVNSCSLNELFYEDTKEDLASKKAESGLIKCPKTYIPKETAQYISNKYKKEYIAKIKKISLGCNLVNNEGQSKTFFLLKYKADIIFAHKNNVNVKKIILPKLYIAIVNNVNEKVLVKVVSELDLSKVKGKLIVNEKKFKFNYNKNDIINIYFGLE